MTGMRSLFVLAMLSAHAAAAAENEAPRVTPELRQRAEDLAGAASKRFTEVLGGEQRGAPNPAPNGTPEQTQDDGPFSRVWEWLARSAQTYDDVVIAQLKNEDGWTVIVQRSGDAAPAPTQIPAARPEEPQPEFRGWSGLVEFVRDWLARANRSYRNEVIKPLLEPAEPGAPSELVEHSPAVTPAPLAPQGAPAAISDADVVKKTVAEEEIKREAEAADAKRVAGEAAAKRKADEDKRLADAAAAKRNADEDKRVADAAAAKRKADEDKRVADAAAAKHKADEDKRLANAAAAKRKADQAKREAEAADDAERKAVAEVEEDAKRQADIDAEATRRSEAASRAKQAARAEIASPAPATPQVGTRPAAASKAGVPPTPTAKSPRAAEASPSPDAAAKENSAVAVAPPEPERKPMPPAPTHQATPKAREGSVVAEVAPPAVSKKRPSYTTRTGKKHASAYRHKRSTAHKKHRQPRYAVGLARKHRAYAAKVVYVERRCDCRCGRTVYKPRKRRHAAWQGYASPRRSGLTYRRGRHYIR